MEKIVLICVLIGVIVYQGLTNWFDRKAALNRENDLLNRIYSENFPEYVDGTGRLRRKPDKPLTTKERIAGINAAKEIDQDFLEIS